MPPFSTPPTCLVYTQTAAYRHRSIPKAIAAVQNLGKQHGFSVESTEDPLAFRTANLERFKAVVFLNTSGNVLDTEGRAAFEAFVAAGGGFAGVHAACDTGYDWPWYGNLVGAYFRRHPRGLRRAEVRIEDHRHPSTHGLPRNWIRWDEWYDFRENPRARARVRVLAVLDEQSYSDGGMGSDHPIVWCQESVPCKERAGGRMWYTGLGHTQGAFADSKFLRHLLGGLRYVMSMDRDAPAV